ncbi:hypothetical protein HGRIS_007173 [Hohenbuehelia grisea]|uniref:Major facilitator superfamily (MFS) profile domain-containing protein n=1 Tax=Hohenbuehelia grisea TaxID=104357 RepID=A0ABR3JBK7_9AGAR
MQAAEPLSAHVISPFVNQFVRETGVTHGDESKTGYYAGVVGTVFLLAECFTVLLWGRASDRVGRKPILLMGMIGLSVSMLWFGLSTQYPSLVLARAAQGVFNGNVGVSRNVIAEITDPSNVADAFAFIPVFLGIGQTAGPLIGGALSRPTEAWPRVFGRTGLLLEHPYLLPCLVTGFYSLLCFVLGSVYLKETLPTAHLWKKTGWRRHLGLKRPKRLLKRVNISKYAAINTQPYHEDTEALQQCDTTSDHYDQATRLNSSPIRDILVRPVILSLITQAFQGFTNQSFQLLLPLVYSTSIPLGGLGLDASAIGAILGTWGAIVAVFQLAFFARSVRRFGARAVFMFSYSAFFVSIGSYPVINYFARKAGGIDAVVLTVLFIQMCAYVCSSMSYGSNQIFIISAVPAKEALATTNAVSQLVNSLMRGIGQAVASSLFSFSLQHPSLFGGHSVYVVLLTFVFLGIFTSSKLPKTV